MIASMFGQKAAIRKYQSVLPEALTLRFGTNGPYTQAQVDKTVEDLNLNRRYIYFAYLLYCRTDELNTDIFTPETQQKMHATIASASPIAAGSFFSASSAFAEDGNEFSGGFNNSNGIDV